MGTWVAHLEPTLAFLSGPDLRVVRLSTQNVLQILSLLLPLPLPPPHSLLFSLSKINKVFFKKEMSNGNTYRDAENIKDNE